MAKSEHLNLKSGHACEKQSRATVNVSTQSGFPGTTDPGDSQSSYATAQRLATLRLGSSTFSRHAIQWAVDLGLQRH